MNTRISALAAIALVATPAFSQDVLTTNNGIIQSALCIGLDCAAPENFGSDRLKLKGQRLHVLFDDTSTDGTPDNDWRLVVNELNAGGRGMFAIEDVTGGTTPFKVIAGAPDNQLFLSDTGRVGIGTSLPQTDLHIVGELATGTVGLRLEEAYNTRQVHDLRTSSVNGFGVSDITFNTTPFFLRRGAPTSSIDVTSAGNVGLGTSAPEGKLHTRGAGTQLAYFESSDGGAVQVRFRTDSENRRFLAVNNANEVKSQIVFGDNQIQFLGQTVAQEWLRISSAGIVSSGPTCNPNPCDATFDPEAFTVPQIEERAAYMWENQHLPAIGPTAPEQPFNVTEKLGGVIHELEVAHIYIEQLHERLEVEAADKAELREAVFAQQDIIKDLAARLEALEGS